MRWSDERWVAFLKAQGPRWPRLSFGARCMFPLLLRIVDRAGRRSLDGCGTEGIAYLLRAREQDLAFVIESIEELSDWGLITADGDDLRVPDFRDGIRLHPGSYVRLYTRDTAAWLRLPVVARGLFCLILMESDLAGIFELAPDGIAGLGGHFNGDDELVADALRDLLVDGCLTVNHKDRQLIIANYIDAQEARQSDAARQKAARERARDEAKAAASAWDAELQSVTPQPVVSHDVTSCHSSLSIRSNLSKDPTGKAVDVPETTRAQARAKPPASADESLLNPVVADVLEVLRSASDGALRTIATQELAHKIASHSQAGGFTGRAALEDVLAAVQAAADKEHTAIAAGEFPRSKGPLGTLVMGFVRHARRGDAQRAAAKAEDDAGAVIAVFERMWCKKFGIDVRCPDARDEWAARTIATTLKKHAASIKAPRWGELLEAAVKGYLELTDKGIELKDYPLWEMPNRLSTVLREIRPRRAEPPRREAVVRVDPRENMINGRRAYAEFHARLRAQEESEKLMLKCASPPKGRPDFLTPPQAPSAAPPPVQTPATPAEAKVEPATAIPEAGPDPRDGPLLDAVERLEAEDDIAGLDVAVDDAPAPYQPEPPITAEERERLLSGAAPTDLLETRELATLAGQAQGRRALRPPMPGIVPSVRDGPQPFAAAMGDPTRALNMPRRRAP